MAETRFSEKADRLLMYAKWHPGRSVDISKYEQMLAKNGIEIFPPVREFMKEFYGLRIMWPISVETGELGVMHFDEGDAIGFTHKGQANYIRRIGKPVCAIGGIEYDPYFILMDSDGKVYIEQLDFLALIGNTGTEAIENLLTNTIYGELEGAEIPKVSGDTTPS